MPLHRLLRSILNRRGLTLNSELEDFMQIEYNDNKHSICKSAYLKQRMNLNPKALELLYRFHNKNFYKAPQIHPRQLNDYLILTADASKIIISTTTETWDIYDGVQGSKKPIRTAQIGLECIRDVLNHLIIDCSINRHSFDEARAIERLLGDNINDIIDNKKYIIVLDRNYPSILMFLRFIEKGIKFVVRLAVRDYQHEQENMSSDDEIVHIKMNWTALYKDSPDYDFIKQYKNKSFPLRFVRIKLDNGTTEYLATNLSEYEFSTANFRELYHIRWTIENGFRNLKSKLQLENFTGTKNRLILQDIYSSIYIHNLAEHIAWDIENDPEK